MGTEPPSLPRLASSLEGGSIASFLYPMVSIAACFSSLLVVTDRERVDADGVYWLPPIFPRFPSFHFSYLVRVKSVSLQGGSGEREHACGSVSRRGETRKGFFRCLNVCQKRTYDHILLTVLFLRGLESLLSMFRTSILLVEKLSIFLSLRYMALGAYIIFNNLSSMCHPQSSGCSLAPQESVGLSHIEFT